MSDRRSLELIKEEGNGPVIYWMSRDQRAYDNWALIQAQNIALQRNVPLFVVFVLRPITNPTFNPRHYQFMLKGLQEVHNDLSLLGISFKILQGEPIDVLPSFIKTTKASLIIKDFSPLKGARSDNEKIKDYCSQHHLGFTLVDAHNIVPVWEASDKKEYGARFFRRKIQQLLPQYLAPYPELKEMKGDAAENNWKEIYGSLGLRQDEIDKFYPKAGYRAGMKRLEEFILSSLPIYSTSKNDPNSNSQSGLSPYLHFGQISALRVALEVEFKSDDIKNKEAFLDELIVWRELADNYCFYEKNYDNPQGYPNWAIVSHKKHRDDAREYIYVLKDLEEANTHDQLWNAAQKHMIIEGKMSGYLRMYWAKKIMEWSLDFATAHKYAIYLNDKYSLDGRDPNGYAGIAWSIGGVHDRPWFEREVFGQIRYMSFNGCKNKFNIFKYIDNYASKNIQTLLS